MEEPQAETKLINRTIPEEVRHITERNAINSPFLRLPGELRNEIYSYFYTPLLHLQIRLRLWPNHVRVNGDRDPELILQFRNQLILPQTCQQMYQEIGNAVYSNIFIFDKHEGPGGLQCIIPSPTPLHLMVDTIQAPHYYARYIMFPDEFRMPHGTLTSTFPNLKRLYFNKKSQGFFARLNDRVVHKVVWDIEGKELEICFE